MTPEQHRTIAVRALQRMIPLCLLDLHEAIEDELSTDALIPWETTSSDDVDAICAAAVATIQELEEPGT